MDPDAALGAFWRCFERENYSDALEYADNLYGWLRGGGFAPEWNVHGGKAAFEKAVKTARKRGGRIGR